MSTKLIILNYIEWIYERLPSFKPSLEKLNAAKIVAHRGDHIHHKENTLKAFEACIKNNIYGIELDIRWTKDLQPIIFHDNTAERVFNRPDVSPSELTLNELKSEIPEILTLKEVIEKFQGKICFFFEIKTPFTGFSKKQQMSQTLEGLLKPLTAGRDFFILSLDSNNFQLVPFIDKKFYCLIAKTNIKNVTLWAIDNAIGFVLAHYYVLSNKTKLLLESHNINWATGYANNLNTLFREINRGSYFIFSNNAVDLQIQLNKLLTL